MKQVTKLVLVALVASAVALAGTPAWAEGKNPCAANPCASKKAKKADKADKKEEKKNPCAKNPCGKK